MSGNRQKSGPAGASAFGAALRRHRCRLGLSQEDLADATHGGVAVRTISDLERGWRSGRARRPPGCSPPRCGWPGRTWLTSPRPLRPAGGPRRMPRRRGRPGKRPLSWLPSRPWPAGAGDGGPADHRDRRGAAGRGAAAAVRHGGLPGPGHQRASWPHGPGPTLAVAEDLPAQRQALGADGHAGLVVPAAIARPSTRCRPFPQKEHWASGGRSARRATGPA